MTRINLVPPEELTTVHLFSEFREIKMISKALARSLKTQTVNRVLSKIPKKFTLNTGHVIFFYDKGSYLKRRYELIRKELDKRHINYNKESLIDPDGIMDREPWNNDYIPNEEALCIIRNRIAEKIAMKPHFYRKF